MNLSMREYVQVSIKTVLFMAIYSYLFIYLVEIANLISSYFWLSCVMLLALRYWYISYLTYK